VELLRVPELVAYVYRRMTAKTRLQKEQALRKVGFSCAMGVWLSYCNLPKGVGLSYCNVPKGVGRSYYSVVPKGVVLSYCKG